MKVEVSRLPRGTPLGRRAGLIGIGLLFAGFNTGNNLFYLIFTVMAASEIVGFILAGRTLRRLDAEVGLAARGRVGGPLRVSIAVHNGSRWLPAPALEWKFRTNSGDEGVIRTPALVPGGSGTGTGRFAPTARGCVNIESVEASTVFPLGLARRSVRVDEIPVEAIVTPRLSAALPLRVGRRRGDVRRLAQQISSGEEPVDAREYAPGDDARRIDWKASARTGKVIWRDRRGDPPYAVSVSLDRTGLPGARFEERVSQAAASVVAGLARGWAVGFETDEWEILPRSGPAQRRRILDYLALVQPNLVRTGVGR